MNELIQTGLKFKSKHFTMKAEVLSVDESNDNLSVLLTSVDGHVWVENHWVLQHTIWGFESGDYFTYPDEKTIDRYN